MKTFTREKERYSWSGLTKELLQMDQDGNQMQERVNYLWSLVRKNVNKCQLSNSIANLKQLGEENLKGDSFIEA